MFNVLQTKEKQKQKQDRNENAKQKQKTIQNENQAKQTLKRNKTTLNEIAAYQHIS